MRLNTKTFFALFPAGYWIVIGVGVVFHLISAVSQLGNLLINLGAFLVAVKGAVIIHESGHLIAAKLVGGTPRRVVLGKGHELYRTRILDIRVIVNSQFLGGHAYATFEQPGFLKLRYAVFILGGAGLNLICAFVISTFFEMNFSDPRGEVIVAIPFAFCLANVLMLYSLVPYYTTIMGMKVPTDGLALLKLPFTSLGEIEKRIDVGLWFDGHEFLEKKDYHSAWNVFNEYLGKYPDTKIIAMHLSLILLKTGKPEQSLEKCLKLLNHLEDEDVKAYKGYIYNQIAWTYLVLNNITEADHYSALAIKAAPNESYIQGTRGSVLIEKGIINEGMTLLFHTMDFQFVNSATLSSAMYLMLGYHTKYNSKERDKYFRFLQKNEDRLEADERILYDRNVKKMQRKELAR